MKTKRFLAFLLALALSLGLAAPAFAAGPGELITPFQYSEPPLFRNGYAPIIRDGKRGLINTEGNEFLLGQYDVFSYFNDGRVAVGIFVRRTNNGSSIYRWGVIDTAGKLIVPCEYEAGGDHRFENGLIKWYRDGKYGYLDVNGQEVVPLKYDIADDFSDGYARVSFGNKWGMVDDTGREVIPCVYDQIYSFQVSAGKLGSVKEGMAHMELNGKHGFANIKGELAVPCKYDEVSDFNGGYAAVGIAVGEKKEYGHNTCKWGIVNASGQEVVPCQYDSDYPNLAYGVMPVKQNGKWGYVNTAGKMIVPCKYDHAWEFINGLGAVCLNDKYGYVNAAGKEVVPCKYDGVLAHTKDLWPLQDSKGKWGYVDITGKVVVPFQYDCGTEVISGHADVERNGKWGSIDTTGKEILPCKYDDIRWVEIDGRGFALVNLNGKWGVVDAAGTQLTPFQYDYVTSYMLKWKGGVVVGNGGKYGIINSNGRESASCQYDSVDISDDGKYAIVKKDGKAGLVEVATGKEIVPCAYESVHEPAEGRVAVRQGGKWAVACIGETFSTGLLQQAEKAKNDQTLSGWARDEVSAAILAGLVPSRIQGSYHSNITREEFCRLMTTLVEKSTGKDIKSYAASKGLDIADPFTDTDSPEVLAAHALGIVNGTSDTTFNPKGSITRQEAAAMLARTGRLLGLAPGQGVSFTDAGKFASWAGSEIAYVSGLVDPVSGNRVMNGVSSDRFDPTGPYTREQAIMTTLRLFRCAA